MKPNHVDVPYPDIGKDKLPMGFRPLYQTYVDNVIEHLGGQDFRETAEDELINRFLHVVEPGAWSKVKPELKNDRITFPDTVRYADYSCEKDNKITWENQKNSTYSAREYTSVSWGYSMAVFP